MLKRWTVVRTTTFEEDFIAAELGCTLLQQTCDSTEDNILSSRVNVSSSYHFFHIFIRSYHAAQNVGVLTVGLQTMFRFFQRFTLSNYAR